MTSVMIMTTPGDVLAAPFSLQGFNLDLVHHHCTSAAEVDRSTRFLARALGLRFSSSLEVVTSSSSLITLSLERPRSSSSPTFFLRKTFMNEQLVRIAKLATDAMTEETRGIFSLIYGGFSSLGLSISL